MTSSWLFWGWSWGSDHSDARTGWPTAHLQEEVTGGTKCNSDIKSNITREYFHYEAKNRLPFVSKEVPKHLQKTNPLRILDYYTYGKEIYVLIHKNWQIFKKVKGNSLRPEIKSSKWEFVLN